MNKEGKDFLKNWHILDKRFSEKKFNYLFQSVLTSIALFLIFFFEDRFASGAILAGIGSTIALIFLVPHSIATHPRRVLGGHIVAILLAFIVLMLLNFIFGDFSNISANYLKIASVISIGFLIMIMGITNTEHPPAAACLLGLILNGMNFERIISILAAVILLIVIRFILINKLKNLI
jgi:CBS-domain-containing membrane protein